MILLISIPLAIILAVLVYGGLSVFLAFRPVYHSDEIGHKVEDEIYQAEINEMLNLK